MKNIVFVFFLCLLNSCSFFKKDIVVLQINESHWTNRQFAHRLSQKITRFNRLSVVQNKEFLDHLKQEIISDLLLEYLVLKKAQKSSITVSQKEVAKALDKIQRGYNTPEVFDLYLEKTSDNKQTFKQTLKYQLLYQKVFKDIGALATPPSTEELKDYYKNHPDLFRKKASLLITHLFHKDQHLLLKIKKELKLSPKKSLKEVAEQWISDPFAIKNQWVKKGDWDLFDQAFSLKTKAISPVKKSAHGYHIIQVLDRRKAVKLSYEKSLPRITAILMEKRKRALFNQWLADESEKVKVWQNKIALSQIKVELN